MASILEILLRAKGGDQVKREVGKGTKAGQDMSKVFSALGAMLSVGILAKGISSSIKAYAKQEVAVTKLNAALKATGRFTEATSKRLQDFATSLQKTTTFGDETILAVEAMLATFKLAPETIEAATIATLDMAAATGTDAVSAAILMGKAAVGEIGTLSRYGIIVDKAALKTEGFAAVLNEINSEFGGTAEAIAKSGIGPLEQFKNTMGDVNEIVGETLIPVINTLIGLMFKLGKQVTGNNEKVNEEVSLYKKIQNVLSERNKGTQEYIQMLRAVASHDERMMKIIAEKSEKEQKAHKLKIEMSEVWLKKIAEAEKKERKAREKIVKAEAKEIKERYDFRRELRELDLDEVITHLENELKEVSESEDKKKALHLALDDFKKELRAQEAVEIEAMNDKVTDLFVGATKDWEGAWNSFRDYIVDFILRDIASELVKTIGLGKALKGALGIATGGVSGIIGGLLGFQHGGTVPGPIGQPTIVKAHGGEKFIPAGRPGNESGGRGMTLVVNISGTFIDSDETKWSRMFRQKIYPEMQRMLKKTGEQFSGG